jgi:hypothetical protein
MALALVYDPRYHTFTSWASLMVEAYGGQQLEIPSSDEEWKGWAAGLKGIDLFANEGVPDPYLFQNWEDWAQSLVNVVNQKVN